MTELLSTQKSNHNELKILINKVNNGTPVEEVKKEFNSLLDKLGIQEFALIENELLQEGLPREKLEKLCDVHASLIPNFKFNSKDVKEIPGHPVNSFLNENKEIKALLEKIQDQFQNLDYKNIEEKMNLIESFNLLYDIEKHFLRKEMLLFPLLEQHGFDGPSKVMWGIHDNIRFLLNTMKTILLDQNNNLDGLNLVQKYQILKNMIQNLLFKEENVLYPTSIQMLSTDEWRKIYNESLEYGYCLYAPEVEWEAETVFDDQNLLSLNFDEKNEKSEFIKLPTGIFTPEQLTLLFSHLPISITLIDENDTVKFYSHGKNKIFNRTNAIIGRRVQNCHPPKSLDMVNKILREFKDGKRDQADFWINKRGSFVYISFYPIRDNLNNYKGVIEFVQDLTYLKTLEGEKRIYS